MGKEQSKRRNQSFFIPNHSIDTKKNENNIKENNNNNSHIISKIEIDNILKTNENSEILEKENNNFNEIKKDESDKVKINKESEEEKEIEIETKDKSKINSINNLFGNLCNKKEIENIGPLISESYFNYGTIIEDENKEKEEKEKKIDKNKK